MLLAKVATMGKDANTVGASNGGAGELATTD